MTSDADTPQPVAHRHSQPKVSVIFPCLNEVRSVATCVKDASRIISNAGLAGEVLVADNGSNDGSAAQAREAGARVVHVARRGYGHAIRGGIAAAQGRDLIIADADGSYELGQIPQMVALLRTGYDLVVGNRWAGTIEPSAMPWQNRYVGNPILSGVGRLFYQTNLRDFHCGLRGLRADAWRRLDLRTGGMEFASEMIVKAAMAGLRTAEFPTTLRPRAKGSISHLRPWRDGWRHLSLLIRCRFQARAGTALAAKPV